jgi:hypothetical protein
VLPLSDRPNLIFLEVGPMSFETWYLEIPIITRCYFTISVITTLACYFDLISPFTLYLNYRLIWEKMEVQCQCWLIEGLAWLVVKRCGPCCRFGEFSPTSSFLECRAWTSFSICTSCECAPEANHLVVASLIHYMTRRARFRWLHLSRMCSSARRA